MRKLAAEFFGTFCLVFAGPISGASMNPARSLGPALLSLQLEHLWIHLIAPPLGAALAVVSCRCIQPSGCCTAGEEAC